MSMLYGALGAFFVLMIFLLGAIIGWKLRGGISRGAPDERGETAEEQKRLQEMQARQEAFLQMQRYSAETAYGIGDTEEELERSERA